ncbi:Chloroperoxidase [Dichotomopilus funicola]|uniref:Chloroperoxidase n=1 Tax=Dichotomopilus funicola TaxID=1934379 RepID=A0AAN6V273_9PEZI|nr:Chloroperoxidase [Dichotomopilus funicola]
MKSFIIFLSYVSTLLGSIPSAYAHKDCDAVEVPEWHPPRPNDFRGPCPMMNTLANHGILPRDGRKITRQAVIDGMGRGLNFAPALATIMFDQAIIANPEPNATFFTLDHLNRHNVLEHDASLSRTDAFFGSNHIFNQTIFDQTKRYWPEPLITTTHMANAKIARQIDSKAFNPEYRFTEAVEHFSLGEMAAPFIAFGDLEAATVNRTLVEYFFQHERLPTELGWRVRDEVVSVAAILRISGLIGNATSLFVDSGEGSEKLRRGFHAAFESGL